DVHQGNGTAKIFQNDSSVFTFSIHGEKNFPFRKEKSDLDIGLQDNIGDDYFLNKFKIGLDEAFSKSKPDLVIYLAGADPFIGDRLGRLDVSKEGLADRDRLVFEACFTRDVPTAVTMAGGYAPNIEDIVEIHLNTVKIALEYINRVQ
ncbi:MAG: histone deacetylase, partial [Chloroflexota bacterium]